MQESSGVLAAKKELRQTGKATRAAAFRQHGTSAGQRLAAGGLTFASTPAGAVISGFLPIGEELDPLPLLLRLHGEGYRLALPVMVGKGRPLIFRQWQPDDPLKETLWGIREPMDTAPEVEPQIVLSALLAFDRKGFRLSYGGGLLDITPAPAKSAGPGAAVGVP